MRRYGLIIVDEVGCPDSCRWDSCHHIVTDSFGNGLGTVHNFRWHLSAPQIRCHLLLPLTRRTVGTRWWDSEYLESELAHAREVNWYRSGIPSIAQRRSGWAGW